MTFEELRRIGLIQLEIMDQVHRICEEEKITYYMIAGTLLGAVRHGGFIPWDLDIDIGMPREDYEHFKSVCNTRLQYPYVYLDYTKSRVFFRPHALITRADTQIEIKYDCVNPKLWDLGIYIDVFPLDNAPDDAKLRKKHEKRLLKIRKIKDKRIPYCYSYNKWRRFVHYAISFALSWIPVQRLNQYQQKQMQKYRNEKTKCICSMGSKYSYIKQCMSKEIYGTPVLLDFEGRKYCAPEKYREYLTQLYGDYMKLPPEDKRNANLEGFLSVVFPKEFESKDKS